MPSISAINSNFQGSKLFRAEWGNALGEARAISGVKKKTRVTQKAKGSSAGAPSLSLGWSPLGQTQIPGRGRGEGERGAIRARIRTWAAEL